jgi:hypothetical protein
MIASWPLMATAVLLAPIQLDYWQLAWTSLGMLAILLIGALIISWVDRWRKNPPPERPLSGDQLAHFRTLFEEGELSQEEFDRLRGLLTQRMRQELDVTPGPAAVPEPAGPQTGSTGPSAGAEAQGPAPPETPPPPVEKPQTEKPAP